MKIVAPKDLQRLNCGFIGWQLQTTELLVKNTVSTSITVHLLVSLLAPPPTTCATPSISLQTTKPTSITIYLLVNLIVHLLVNLVSPLNASHWSPPPPLYYQPSHLQIRQIRSHSITWYGQHPWQEKKDKRALSTCEFSILRLRWYPTTDWLHSYRVKRAICATLTNEMGGVQLCSCAIVQLCSCGCIHTDFAQPWNMYNILYTHLSVYHM